ncbi:MAG: hypothetical protein K2K56_05935 [Lachnospiraceae bacterium]|nr:hypothetical protein [Lachnospiraceae bacterium]
MKCKYCGAEIREGSRVCEYCDSEVERDIPETQTVIIEEKSSSKSIARVIGKVIIVLACVWGAVMVISLVIVLNSDAFKNFNEYSSGTYTDYEIPANETGLTAQIISCDENGVASIEYKYHTYEKVKILDEALIEWLNKTGKRIDGVTIYFATDGKGDISELGLLSANFFVVAKEGTRYTAIREDKVITFTSSMSLETDCCYSGYFSYPDTHLYWGEEESPLGLSYMDPKCSDKDEATWQEYYTGEDIPVYKLLIEEKWYYCSKETYDAIQIDDLLNGYMLCEEQGLAFVVRK